MTNATDPLQAEQIQRFRALKYKTALALVVACPILVVLPPRKLDVYTFCLCTAFVGSLNQVVYERTGSSILYRFAAEPLPTDGAEQLRQRQGADAITPSQRPRGLLKHIWMGNEQEGWQQRRIQEEQNAFSQGKGYGQIIMDQISEVWHGGKDKNIKNTTAKQEQAKGKQDEHE